nr:hypothetical protein [Parasporobacterium sp.]
NSSITSYADSASLRMEYEDEISYVPKQLQMVGAASLDDAKGTDPSFVIGFYGNNRPTKYWIGEYDGKTYYAFNIDPSTYGSVEYTFVTLNGQNVVREVKKADSDLAVSWETGTSGATIDFSFGVGSCEQAGAAIGAVNYKDERIEDLKPSIDYEITVGQNTIVVTSAVDESDASKGYIPLTGVDKDGNEYDLTGKTVLIKEKDLASDHGHSIDISGRPEATEAETAGSDDVTTASKPEEVGSDIISTTEDSIIINLDNTDTARMAQEYCLFAADGTTQISQSWVKPSTSGVIEFTGLNASTSYLIKARVPASSSAPASYPTQGVSVTTIGTIIVVQPTEKTAQYDGNEHSFPVTATPTDAVITYSTREDQAYTEEIPSFTDAGTYTVYYKAVKDGYRSAYGSFEVKVLRNLENALVKLENSRLSYTGSALTPTIASVTLGGKTLEYGVDYIVKEGYSATDKGDYTLVIEGKGVYSSTASATWTITGNIVSASVSGEAKNGETLTVNTAPANQENIVVEWYRDGVLIVGETTTQYILKPTDIGKRISAKVLQNTEDEGLVELYTTSTEVVGKAASDNVIPTTPTLKEKTGSTIAVNTQKGYEYSIDGGLTWNKTGVFTNLTNNQTYNVLTRKAETAYSEAGAASVALQVVTNTNETSTKVKERETINQGSIETHTNIAPNVPASSVDNLTTELAKSIMTTEEYQSVENGECMLVYLDITDIGETVSADDKELLEAVAKVQENDTKVGMYLDLSLFKQVGTNTPSKITDLNGNKIKVTIDVPDEFKPTDGTQRTYFIVRIHDGVTEILAQSTSTSISFETDRFSTYALLYSDAIQAEPTQSSVTPADVSTVASPDTGDHAPIAQTIVVLFIAISLLSTVVTVTIKKKRS